MASKDPTERALIARVAAHTRWAKTRDRQAATAKARQAALDRFARQVDPDGTMDPAERAKLAESARQAHFLGLALKSAQARRGRRRDGVPLADAQLAEDLAAAAQGGEPA